MNFLTNCLFALWFENILFCCRGLVYLRSCKQPWWAGKEHDSRLCSLSTYWYWRGRQALSKLSSYLSLLEHPGVAIFPSFKEIKAWQSYKICPKSYGYKWQHRESNPDSSIPKDWALPILLQENWLFFFFLRKGWQRAQSPWEQTVCQPPIGIWVHCSLWCSEHSIPARLLDPHVRSKVTESKKKSNILHQVAPAAKWGRQPSTQVPWLQITMVFSPHETTWQKFQVLSTGKYDLWVSIIPKGPLQCAS